MESQKKLRTIKKASGETGSSPSFFKQLIRENKLTKYQINSAVFIDLQEFEKIAQPVNH
jgi:hypothetical protein